ncbi:MAG TPA: glycine cleavage T C-terminal barrel domain-containing protein [Rhizomicrobium sp.]
MIRATPFHARTAEANRDNLWTMRNRFTLPAQFGEPAAEATAARFGVVMADISWRWRVMLEGARTRELVQRLFTRDAAALNPGQALKALWLSDGGGVRGAGVVARHGRQSFQLVAAAEDAAWISSAAALFGVTARDVTEEEAGLALIGPYAGKLVAALGLDAALEPLALRKFLWRNLEVTLSRFGEQGGYELWCKSEDATLLWDRVARAGEAFANLPAGQIAMDTLDLEAGVPRPGRDYDGAIAADVAEPLAGELRLAALIDAEHLGFNGRSAAMAARPNRRLVGLALDSSVPAPFTPVLANGAVVGRTLSSLYSPLLRRAIALAQLDEAHAAAGTRLTLTLPAARDVLLPTVTAASVVDLPFLAPPDSIPP